MSAEIEMIVTELKGLVEESRQAKNVYDNQFREMKAAFEGRKPDSEWQAKFDEQSKSLQDLGAKLNNTLERQKDLEKELAHPIHSSSPSEQKEADYQFAVELQRAQFKEKYADKEMEAIIPEQLVDADAYRSAAKKLMRVGIESPEVIVDGFNEKERHAFTYGMRTVAGGAVNFFSPQLLGITVDCEPECGTLLDLYDNINLTRTTYRYMVEDGHGSGAGYSCSLACNAPKFEDGNIEIKDGRVASFRGAFCVSREMVEESGYDILSRFYREAARIHRVLRNKELINGSGKNHVDGWANGDFFPVIKTHTAKTLTPAEVRLFQNAVPREFGNTVLVMHQNLLSLLISSLDANGRFLFGDGQFVYTPENIGNIRVSNCLFDPTYGLTKGLNDLNSGDFLMASANWGRAFHAVTHRPLWFKLWLGESNEWCSTYQFGATEGGFRGCAEAGRILVVS